MAPAVGLGGEAGAPARREPVILRAAVGLALLPVRAQVAAFLQAVEGGVERALLDAQHVVGSIANAPNDAVPVLRSSHENLEDEHVQRAPQKIRSWVPCHDDPLVFLGEYSPATLDCQGEFEFRKKSP